MPFLYSTNGERIRHHDAGSELSLSREAAAFHAPDARRDRLAWGEESTLKALAALPNVQPRFRPCQKEANAAVEAALAKRRRRILVAMATGTGKTFTTANQVYRPFKSGYARRVLFLVDRRVLADT